MSKEALLPAEKAKSRLGSLAWVAQTAHHLVPAGLLVPLHCLCLRRHHLALEAACVQNTQARLMTPYLNAPASLVLGSASE